ncbi:S-layer homology domain-containing protein [Collinsella tanakaei]|uniref:S-layer homology domain-containing protein n=1 Tax=Collinsella tanakaei TaxID=626935 RepID=UPI00195A0F54|nr:S-layer homology domain-containing protein [Collinsella tanakaei]MBM6779886.1 S-layer homology domain-containing protein [Collinsella tanakaei]
MTACVNRKHSRRVAAVISASLVGALSLGIAPVAAMANEGVDMLVADTAQSLKDGKVIEWTDADGDVITGTEFTYKEGVAQFVVPTVVDPQVGANIELDGNTAYKIAYYRVVDGTPTDGDQTKDGKKLSYIRSGAAGCETEGTYVAAVLPNVSGVKAIEGAQIEFKIVGNKLENAKVVNAADADSEGFTFRAAGYEYGSGWAIKLGEDRIGVSNELDSIKLYKDGKLQDDLKFVDAGNYTLRIEGKGDYAGQSAEIKFTVSAIDLASAKVTFNNGVKLSAESNVALPDFVSQLESGSTGTITFADLDGKGKSQGWSTADVSGESNDESNRIILDLAFQPDQSTSGTPTDGVNGKFVYKLTAKNQDGSECTNVIGERTITVTRYGQSAAITYDGVANNSTPTSPVRRFDAELVEARITGGDQRLLEHSISYYMDADGDRTYETAVDAADTVWPGDYIAHVEVVDDTFAWGGAKDIYFKVDAVTVQEADAYITFRGEPIDEGDTVEIYSGSDLMADLGIEAFDRDGDALPADAFELEVKDSEGNVVTELVNAGTYTATIKEKAQSMYRLDEDADADVEFTVDPVKLTYTYGTTVTKTGNGDIRLAGAPTVTGISNAYVYTGGAVVPTYEYDLTDARFGYDKAVEWVALPEGAYKVEYQKYNETSKAWEDVDECVEPGNYVAILSDNAKDDNYVVDARLTFEITDTKVFLDVPNDFWAAESVYEAAANGWMSGYGYTGFFGPNDNIKRGDVAVVLYKMAGQPEFVDEGQYDETTGFKTGFGDVDGKMYYAEAILWAKQAGIVSGDEGTGMFRPEDSISRQELAKMLTVYAEKCNEDVSSDVDAVLGEYEDANTVSEWAKGYVAYLVEAGVMGNESPLRATDPITRAEVATMVVRLSDTVDFDNVIFK